MINFLDTAIDRNHALGPKWVRNELIKAREALDYVIFAVLERNLKPLQFNYYYEFNERFLLMKALCQQPFH